MKPNYILRRQSRELFPHWSRGMRAKWVLARISAKGMKPLYRMKGTKLDAHSGRGDERQQQAA